MVGIAKAITMLENFEPNPVTRQLRPHVDTGAHVTKLSSAHGRDAAAANHRRALLVGHAEASLDKCLSAFQHSDALFIPLSGGSV